MLGRKTGGRQKGTPNKVSQSTREAVLNVYARIGGEEQFAVWASENQTEFYKIYAKLLPTEISGPGGSAIPLSLTPADAAILGATHSEAGGS